MTIDELKGYTPEQQKEVYLLFYSAFSAATQGSPKYHQYRIHLEQLRTIFGHDHEHHAKIIGECAAKLFLVKELLETHMGEPA